MANRRYFFGEWIDDGRALAIADIDALWQKAEAARKLLQDYPMDRIYGLLDRMKAKWSDPNYIYRKELIEILPSETGFSREMIELGMNEIAWTLDTDILRKKVKTELQGVPRLQANDYLFHPDTNTGLRWSSLGVVLHVLSGNVFLVGLGSLVEGLLTGNVTILKMASGEREFLPRLIQSLIDCDDDGVISRCVAVIDYSSNQKDVMGELKRRVDGIVVWGGEDAVKAYRNDLPARTRILLFGPKLSFGIVTQEGLRQHGINAVAEKLATEISIWDQNACTAPQVCYVQGRDNALSLVEALGVALVAESKKLPAGPAEMNTAVEIQKMRSVFEIAEAKGKSLLKVSPRNVDWTVALDENPVIEPSPLHRTIRVIPVDDLLEPVRQAESLRGYIQTVGLIATQTESMMLTRKLSEVGALRVFELGAMFGGEIDDPHDGAYDLPQLVNFVVSRTHRPHSDLFPIDTMPRSEFEAVLNQRLRLLVDKARKAPFYAKRLEGVRIETVEDLVRIPILTREEMETNMPPQGMGLSTGPFTGGYVSRSGGSTGEPKFSVYDGHDWEQMISQAVRVFYAAGLRRGDRLANCMLSGDLYGSFVSFDHINSRLGLTTFAFAGNSRADIFLKMWRHFGMNAIQAIPATMLPVLREAKAMEPAFSLEKVVFAGTPLNPSDKQWLMESLGVKRVASIIGANDGGQTAYQCEHMAGATHHTIDDFNYVEIVDDKGNRVPDGESGKIVITSLLKYAFPLIRYDIGDAARVIPGTCTCGRLGRRIEYLGRSDDGICVGLLNVKYRDFMKALEGFEVSAMQLAATNDVRGDSIEIRIESTETSTGYEARVREHLLSAVGKLSENLKSQDIAEFRVRISGIGSLPRNPRSGKIKQIVDERK